MKNSWAAWLSSLRENRCWFRRATIAWNSTQHNTKVITGKHTVFSYLTVNEPKVPLGGGTPKYSVSLIIPKSDTVTVEKIKAAIQAAYDEGQGKLKGNSKTVPALEDLKTPLRDGDKERKGDEAYANAWFINANSTTKPGVVDADRNPILDSSELRHHRAGVDFLLRFQQQR